MICGVSPLEPGTKIDIANVLARAQRRQRIHGRMQVMARLHPLEEIVANRGRVDLKFKKGSHADPANPVTDCGLTER